MYQHMGCDRSACRRVKTAEKTADAIVESFRSAYTRGTGPDRQLAVRLEGLNLFIILRLGIDRCKYILLIYVSYKKLTKGFVDSLTKKKEPKGFSLRVLRIVVRWSTKVIGAYLASVAADAGAIIVGDSSFATILRADQCLLADPSTDFNPVLSSNIHPANIPKSVVTNVADGFYAIGMALLICTESIYDTTDSALD